MKSRETSTENESLQIAQNAVTEMVRDQQGVLKEYDLIKAENVAIKRAEIRNKMRSWLWKVLGVKKVSSKDIKLDESKLTFLRFVGFKSSLMDKHEELNIYIRENPQNKHAGDDAEMEEMVFENAEESMQLAIDKLEQNPIGLWKICLVHKLLEYQETFGSILKYKIKEFKKSLESNEKMTRSMKQKYEFRMQELLTIKIAELFAEKTKGVTDDNFNKIEEILEGAINNGIPIAVVVKYLQWAVKEDPKYLIMIYRWMRREFEYKMDIGNVVKALEEILEYKVASKEDIASALGLALENGLKMTANQNFGVKLEKPEDLKKLEEMPEERLKIYYRNLKSKESKGEDGLVDQTDLEEKFTRRRKKMEDYLTIGKLLGLIRKS